LIGLQLQLAALQIRQTGGDVDQVFLFLLGLGSGDIAVALQGLIFSETVVCQAMASLAQGDFLF
jgi:hypothetical protein